MPNGNQRGSAAQRRARRQWLLDVFGDGVTAMCHLEVSNECEMDLTLDTLTVDRVVPGCEGGTYARGNIQPACRPCSDRQGGRLRAARAAAGQVFTNRAAAGMVLPDQERGTERT